MATSNVPIRLVAELTDSTVAAAAILLRELVANGAALGWVTPPSEAEVAGLLHGVADKVSVADAALAIAETADGLVGIGYWQRYDRATLRPHADIEKIAVAASAQGRGVGRALVSSLITAARKAAIEVLTLDVRGDNHTAAHLYQVFGFREYGWLADFVAVGTERYDFRLFALDLRLPH